MKRILLKKAREIIKYNERNFIIYKMMSTKFSSTTWDSAICVKCHHFDND